MRFAQEIAYAIAAPCEVSSNSTIAHHADTTKLDCLMCLIAMLQGS